MRFIGVVLILTSYAWAQCPAAITTWPAVTALPSIKTLPDPWTYFDGTKVKKGDWACRKKELRSIVEHYHYGVYPDTSKENVTATRNGNTLSITVSANGKSGTFSATLALPSGTGPFPVVIALGGTDNNAFTSIGVATASFQAAAIAADSNSKTGVYWTLYPGTDVGTLLAWGWGYHRIIDAIVKVVPQIDIAKGVAVTGCSRYGKAALASGIFDDRVNLTIPMSAGVQGLAPLRYKYGANEDLTSNTGGAPWWGDSLVPTLAKNLNNIPFDAYSFGALIAPRALVWDQGKGDIQSNPEGAVSVTFPAVLAVYQWLGVGDQVGVAPRDGDHCAANGTPNIIPFVSKIFKGVTTTRNYQSIAPYSDKPETRPWASSPPT